jgi:hypothetical protein
MDRYIINISFKHNIGSQQVSNVVESVKTMNEAMLYADLIDETVECALIKDNVNGLVTWLKY